jgi:hypothetical protein
LVKNVLGNLVKLLEIYRIVGERKDLNAIYWKFLEILNFEYLKNHDKSDRWHFIYPRLQPLLSKKLNEKCRRQIKHYFIIGKIALNTREKDQ